MTFMSSTPNARALQKLKSTRSPTKRGYLEKAMDPVSEDLAADYDDDGDLICQHCVTWNGHHSDICEAQS